MCCVVLAGTAAVFVCGLAAGLFCAALWQTNRLLDDLWTFEFPAAATGR